MFSALSWLGKFRIDFIQSHSLMIFDLLIPSSDSPAGIIVGRTVRSLSAPARGFRLFRTDLDTQMTSF